MCTQQLIVNYFIVDYVCMKEGNKRKGHTCFCEEDYCNAATPAYGGASGALLLLLNIFVSFQFSWIIFKNLSYNLSPFDLMASVAKQNTSNVHCNTTRFFLNRYSICFIQLIYSVDLFSWFIQLIDSFGLEDKNWISWRIESLTFGLILSPRLFVYLFVGFPFYFSWFEPRFDWISPLNCCWMPF